jgi:hypothetical protein
MTTGIYLFNIVIQGKNQKVVAMNVGILAKNPEQATEIILERYKESTQPIQFISIINRDNPIDITKPFVMRFDEDLAAFGIEKLRRAFKEEMVWDCESGGAQ